MNLKNKKIKGMLEWRPNARIGKLHNQVMLNL